MPTLDDYKPGAPLPASVGLCADLLHEVRETRLLMEKQVAAVKAREAEINNHIIETLSASDDTGAAGKQYRAQIVVKEKPTIGDWTAFTTWVAESGRFDCVQKRLGDRAVMDMVEAGAAPPGVEIVMVKQVSITKI